ncbi:MAG TPA: multicopper oxidase domain-containing protein [Nocardioidaceae bacterium]|nr:multicopper oxidase domain-containing protein [Nocardioidaceae bacterium]
MLLPPGNRADLLVAVGRSDGVLRAIPYDRGGMGMMGGRASGDRGPVRLATLAVTGGAPDATGPLPSFAEPRDLRDEDVARRRELVLGMAMGMGGMGMSAGRAMGDMMSFTIDGREFDHERVDQRVRRGAVEEWTIHNDSPMDHPFHLHVWPMQVLEENGRRHDRPVWQDVVNVPARGTVRVRIAFDRFDGRTVYHCHILDHEDRGMMGVVEAS